MPIALVDHIDAALAHMLHQFKGLPRVEGLISATNAELNFIEVALQQLLTITSIDDSEGVQLDVIGRLIGQPRGQKDDTTYRTFLKARLAALRSSGSINELYKPIAITDPGADYWIDPEYPANLRFNFLGVLTEAEVIDRVQLLRASKAGGVGFFFYWLAEPLETTFQFDDDASGLETPWGNEVWGDEYWGGAIGGDVAGAGFSDEDQVIGGALAGIKFF